MKDDLISVVLFTASALVLVPVQAEWLFDSTALYSCSWSYAAILLLINSNSELSCRKGYRFSKYSFVPPRRLISVLLLFLCPQHMNSTCNSVKIGSLYMVVWKLQIYSGFPHTNLFRQAQSCLCGTGPIDLVLKKYIRRYLSVVQPFSSKIPWIQDWRRCSCRQVLSRDLTMCFGNSHTSLLRRRQWRCWSDTWAFTKMHLFLVSIGPSPPQW